MARYNEILVGRFNRRFQKFFSMKGEPPAPQLASEIQPGLQLFTGVEELYLEGFDRFSRIVNNNVVGQTSAFRIRNPVGSGVVAVVEMIIVQCSASQPVNLLNGASATDESSIVTPGQSLDSRGRPNPTCVLSFNSAAPASTVGLSTFTALLNSGTTPNQIILTEGQQIPILPGSLICIAGSTAATGLATTVMWRERMLEESERT